MMFLENNSNWKLTKLRNLIILALKHSLHRFWRDNFIEISMETSKFSASYNGTKIYDFWKGNYFESLVCGVHFLQIGNLSSFSKGCMNFPWYWFIGMPDDSKYQTQVGKEKSTMNFYNIIDSSHYNLTRVLQLVPNYAPLNIYTPIPW